MAYLRRRLEQFVKDLESGTTHFAPAALDPIRSDLMALRRDKAGRIELASCSRRLRSFVRAYYNASHVLKAEPEAASAPALLDGKETDPVKLNRQLFAHFAELFRAGTGIPAEDFVPDGSDFVTEFVKVRDRLRENPKLASARARALHDAMTRLDKHYRESGNARLTAAKDLPGLKFVTGGTQVFSEASLAAARSTLLYCDSLLIPDPVMRYFEVSPDGARFPYIDMLEEAFYLLQLRPLVDEDLPTPALIVFPSWEKLMELHDNTAKDGIEMLAISVFEYVLGSRFDDLEEVFEFARRHPDQLLQSAERRQLFVPIGGVPGMPIAEALKQQREEYEYCRSDEFLAMVRSSSDAKLLCYSVMERLAPQFHASDNGASLGASPLFSLPVHWHYYSLCNDAQTSHYKATAELSDSTIQIMRGLSQTEVPWLGNVPIPELVRLRGEMANIDFRQRLNTTLAMLDGAGSSMDQAVAAVSLALTKLLKEHGAEAKKFDAEYRRKLAQTTTGLLISLGATFLPWLPVAGPAVAATAAGVKIAVDTVDRVLRRRQVGRSLMGVLAASARDHRS